MSDQQTLDCIRRFMRRHSRPPTLVELAKLLHLASTSSVRYRLGRLEDRGLIRRVPGIARGIEVLNGGSDD